jgi:glycogen synthase
MKVLMFGWEFPPQISGGLGPACEGITTALAENGVQIIFVVPKAFGQEPGSKVSLVDASTTDVVQGHNLGSVHNPVTPQEIRSDGQESTQVSSPTTITVQSKLSPYDGINDSFTVESWSAMKKIIQDFIDFLQTPSSTGTQDAIDTVSKRYDFTGTYGDNLMNEIAAYAIVAAQLAKDHTFDVIHVHDWMTIPAGIAAKTISKKKLIIHVHSTVFDRSGLAPDPVILSIEKEGLEIGDRIIAVSEWTKHLIISRYAIPANKIDVVHNGAMAADGEIAKDGRIFNAPVVTFLGRITHQKGPLYFVKAAKKVLEKIPDVHFVMGGTGDLLELVIEEAAKNQISSQIHFPGFVRGKNIARLWAMTDVYVMPSVSEPFGLTPLEAIKAGVPIIISKQSGVAEVMQHAIKVDFWDVNAIAAAICNILSHRPLATTLMSEAKQAVKELTWESAGQKIKNTYTQLQNQN